MNRKDKTKRLAALVEQRAALDVNINLLHNELEVTQPKVGDVYIDPESGLHYLLTDNGKNVCIETGGIHMSSHEQIEKLYVHAGTSNEVLVNIQRLKETHVKKTFIATLLETSSELNYPGAETRIFIADEAGIGDY